MSKSHPTKVIKIDFEPDDDVVFPTATTMLINFDEDQYYIRFYQVKPPTSLDGNLPDTVRAKLVAGITVPESKLKDIVKAFQETLERREEVLSDHLALQVDSLDELGQDDD